MIRLEIHKLKPGMVLSRSVYNQQDLPLLEKGCLLTKRRIWILKTWGIDQVYIKGKPEKDGKNVCEDESGSKESIEAELKARFADSIDDPVMEEIMKAAGRQLQKNLSNPGKENEHT